MPKDKGSAAGIDQGHGTHDTPMPSTWTWELRATEHARPITMVMRCCLCRTPLDRRLGGWCESCRTWPINVTPINRPSFEPHPGEWIDTGITPQTCPPQDTIANARRVSASITGPGWPEKVVPLRRDMIPRHWRKKDLVVTGQTPLGYDIVIPREHVAGIADGGDDVPF